MTGRLFKTGRFFDAPPEAFVCVICGRPQEPQPWTLVAEFRPPLCNCCSSAYAARTRIPGMTRGDHRQMQRLASITAALQGQAGVIEWEGRYGRG